jgi:hypothetical protein
MKKDPRPSRSRQTATFAAAIITAILAACSSAAAPSIESPDRSVDPSAAQALARAKAMSATLPSSYVAQGVLRERPLTRAIAVTQVISNSGGTIDIPEADFRLEVPSGAFTEPTMTITVTALAGVAAAYDFEPHGTTFLAPLKFVQGLSHTNFHRARARDGFQPEGAYFADASLVDPTTGIAVVSEVTPADVLLSNDQLTFPVWHFSGYMASTGRHR